MKALNTVSASVFNRILGLLGEGEHIKIDNTDGAFMPLSVNRLGRDKISLAHYGELNGDLMADPDMVFWLSPGGKIIPCVYQNDYAGSYRDAVSFRIKEDGRSFPESHKPWMQADMAHFANMWLHNIQMQQGI